MNPIDNPKSYDSFLLGGVPSPGVARFSFPERPYGWDQQAGKGSDGATVVLNSTKLVEFDVELYLWRDHLVDHFTRWDSWKKVLLLPVADGSEKALDIYHPQLEEIGVRSVVVKSWAPPQPDGKGGATAKVKFLEYRPVKKKLGSGKPDGSSANGGKKKDPNADTNRAAKEELAKQKDIRQRQRRGDHSRDGEIL